LALPEASLLVCKSFLTYMSSKHIHKYGAWQRNTKIQN
jgi:hypothetical protein